MDQAGRDQCGAHSAFKLWISENSTLAGDDHICRDCKIAAAAEYVSTNGGNDGLICSVTQLIDGAR